MAQKEAEKKFTITPKKVKNKHKKLEEDKHEIAEGDKPVDSTVEVSPIKL